MYELAGKLLRRVVLPFLVAQAALMCGTYGHLPAFMHGLPVGLAELLNVGALIGWGSIFLEEVSNRLARSARLEIKHVIVPMITLNLRSGIREMGKVLAECISAKEFIPAELFAKGVNEPPRPVITTGDPHLEKARKLLQKGDFEAAIELLTQLAKKDAIYEQELLAVLIASPREDHWKTATPLLAKHGTFENYTLVAYRYWSANQVANAIAYADEAIRIATKNKDEGQTVRAKNNLAYYLAAGSVEDRAGEARRLIDEALDLQKLPTTPNQPDADGKLISTLGYVMVTFARDEKELRVGVKKCEEGLEHGANFELFLRHMDRARARLSELRRTTTTQSDQALPKKP